MSEIVLVATLGPEPQIVTLTLDALLARRISVNRVVIVHTHPQLPPINDSLKALHQVFVAERYYKDILYVPHALTDAHEILADVTTPHQIEAAFGNFYALLKHHKAAGNSIHLCIAGGRKTMTIFALSVAQAILTTQDAVWHLVSSSNMIQSKAMYANNPADVQLVQVPFVNLNAENSASPQRFLQTLMSAEREIVELLVREGLPNAILAQRLSKSPKTIANQLTGIYLKLQQYFGLSQPPDRAILLVLLGKSS
jgi:CRISPR-associated protein Csx14